MEVIRKYIFFLIFCTCFFEVAYSQKKENKKNKDITPFITPGYTPDLKFTIAAGSIFSFKTDKKDSTLKRSTIPLSIVYSTTDAVGIFANYTIFLPKDKYRIYAATIYRHQKDNYFGIGYDKAISTPFPDSTFNKKNYFLFQAKFLRRIRNNFYAGIVTDINYTNITAANKHMYSDSYFIKYGPENLNTGIGLIASYDTRDFPQNAYKGLYSTIFFNLYADAFGGKNNYQLLDIDIRKFIPLSITKIKILALNWHSKYLFGNVPYSEMATVGLPFDLRGYLPNQFRDKCLNYCIAEFRNKFYYNNKPTKFGSVAWLGIGGLGGTFSESYFKNSLTNFGIGLRYEMQPRLNVRCDWGFGKYTNEIYFSFQEAF
ncbi:MAG: BamA/TamA family outer membrane protein [Chitinophagaceae bacterium]|nr:BamA/TamA family outer membrane protein [Chitinophagaceae bacterium]